MQFGLHAHNNTVVIADTEKVVDSSQPARFQLTSESALIVPVPESEPVVKDLRVRYDPAASAGVPAHITVLYPFLAPAELDDSILAELKALFSGIDSFPFNLSGIGRFPDVIYLTPDPPNPFVRLTAAIATRWPETPPYGGAHDEIVPHLTVAHTPDVSVAEEVRRTTEPSLPVVCTARRVWLMTSRDGRWTLRGRFPFGRR